LPSQKKLGHFYAHFFKKYDKNMCSQHSLKKGFKNSMKRCLIYLLILCCWTLSTTTSHSDTGLKIESPYKGILRKITIPNLEVLTAEIEKEHLEHFIKNTGILDDLAGKILTQVEIEILINLASCEYHDFFSQKKCNPKRPLLLAKPDDEAKILTAIILALENVQLT